MATLFLFLASLFLPLSECFLTVPVDIPQSLPSPNEEHHKIQNESATIWHRPRFDRKFKSTWYYWRSTPRNTSENIPNGTVYWIFNGSQMHYHFQSVNINYYQHVINETVYLWTTGDSVHCYSYRMPFNVTGDYFQNASFVGLTNGPDLPDVPDTQSTTVVPDSVVRAQPLLQSLLRLQINNTNTTEAPTVSPSHAPSNSPTKSPSSSPSQSPTHSPSESPSDSPTDSPTDSPSISPTDSPSISPSDSPTNSPTNAPSQSPTDSPSRSPTNEPTASPVSGSITYPLSEPEALWTGHLWTEHVFGRNLSYITTAKANGTIGSLYIAFDQSTIDLSVGSSVSTVMWLQNATWDLFDEEVPDLPNECLENPINEPSMAPTHAPTRSPTFSPIGDDPANMNGKCSLPSNMVIVYVVLITVLLLVLFCWFAQKNSLISRMMAGEAGPYYNGYGQGAAGYDFMGQYPPGIGGTDPMRGGGQGGRGMKYGRYGQQFPVRKESDQYVGDQSSDREIE